MFRAINYWLFNSSDLTPHGFCLLWNPGLIWLHAASDLATALAYFSIPLTLAAIIRRRPDLVYRPLFTLFAAFILFCGLGHLLNVVTLWVPAYGIEGLIKAATAVISFVTAISLRGLMPQILLLPSHVQLRKVQSDLAEVRQAEIRMSEIAEEANATRAAMSLELARREAARHDNPPADHPAPDRVHRHAA